MKGSDSLVSGAAEHKRSPIELELGRLHRALRAAGALCYDWDMASDRMAWSEGAAAVLGLDGAEDAASAAAFEARIAPDDRPRRGLALARHLSDDAPFDCIYKLRRRDGGMDWLHERGVAEKDADGKPCSIAGIVQVVTEAKRQRDRLERLAHWDELTGHLNRAGLREAFDQLLRVTAEDGREASFLAVKIDNLGAVYEGYGHEVADAVIVEVGRRVRKVLAAADRVGRLSGNQFGVVLDGQGEAGMAAVADRVLKAVRGQPVATRGGPIAVSVSIGGAALDAGVDSFAAVLGRAEEAVTRAKRAGRDRFVSYRLPREQAESRRLSLATGDRVLAALKESRLRLAFQPIVTAATGRPVMYECLLRMLDEGGHVVPAGEFIPAVERLGLVRLVDRCTLELALLELDTHPDIRLAVNVSGISAADPAALADLVELVEAHRSLAERLAFEITETVAMKDFAESARFAVKLRDLGCSVAVDDFGAGYTSFRHLKSLAVDMVKIDGEFVQDVSRNQDNQLFVDTLVRLAQGLGLTTVAECVETAADATALAGHGVELLQGYYFGRPALRPPWAGGGRGRLEAAG